MEKNWERKDQLSWRQPCGEEPRMSKCNTLTPSRLPSVSRARFAIRDTIGEYSVQNRLQQEASKVGVRKEKQNGAWKKAPGCCGANLCKLLARGSHLRQSESYRGKHTERLWRVQRVATRIKLSTGIFVAHGKAARAAGGARLLRHAQAAGSLRRASFLRQLLGDHAETAASRRCGCLLSDHAETAAPHRGAVSRPRTRCHAEPATPCRCVAGPIGRDHAEPTRTVWCDWLGWAYHAEPAVAGWRLRLVRHLLLMHCL